MDDPNSAAVANAIAAGGNLWRNIFGLRNLQLQNKEMGMKQQQLGMEQAKTTSQLQTEDIARQQAKQQLAQSDIATKQMQKQQTLDTLDPLQQLRSTYPKIDNAATNEQRADFINSGGSIEGLAKPGFYNNSGNLVDLSGSSLPNWEDLGSDAQQNVVKYYQNEGQKKGLVVSPDEAVQSYRRKYIGMQPPPSPGSMGMTPVSGEMTTPQGIKLNLQAPIGGSVMTPQQYKDYGQPLSDTLKNNEELKTAFQKSGHVDNVISYANTPVPTVSSDKSMIMSYLKTIDPTVRVSEGTVTTVMDQMGLPEEMRNAANKVLHGSLFTPEHREWFKQAAIDNLNNARQTAAESIQAQLGIAEATGNPLAGRVNLPPTVLPPSKTAQKGGSGNTGRGDGTVPGSAGDKMTGGVRKFTSMQQAESAHLPPGTIVQIYDPASGMYRRAVSK